MTKVFILLLLQDRYKSVSNIYTLFQVSLRPSIAVPKGQQKVLKGKANLKDFVYSIMGMLWTREVLSTHSITGKSSNAFKERDAKPQLDQEKCKDICGKLI